MSDVKRTYLICGPQWVPDSYYRRFYRNRVAELVADKRNFFVLGAADGVDLFAQRQLAEAGAGARA